MPQPRNKLNRRIRRGRRRLGRFVAFSEMLTDLTPKPLIEPAMKPKPSLPAQHR